jgi:hypothetical protein
MGLAYPSGILMVVRLGILFSIIVWSIWKEGWAGIWLGPVLFGILCLVWYGMTGPVSPRERLQRPARDEGMEVITGATPGQRNDPTRPTSAEWGAITERYRQGKKNG